MHSNMGRNKGYEHSAGIRNGDQLAGDAAETKQSQALKACNGLAMARVVSFLFQTDEIDTCQITFPTKK